MASILANPCDKCEHVDVCAYRSSYERIVSEIGNFSVIPSGALANCKLSEVDVIRSVFITCKYFQSKE